MTKPNYQEMRSKDTTEVFVPLFDKVWELPLYAAVYNMLTSDVPSCSIRTPFNSGSSWSKLQHTETIYQAYKFKYNINAAVDNSGEYVVKCSGTNWDEPGHKSMKVWMTKSLKITFIQSRLY